MGLFINTLYENVGTAAGSVAAFGLGAVFGNKTAGSKIIAEFNRCVGGVDSHGPENREFITGALLCGLGAAAVIAAPATTLSTAGKLAILAGAAFIGKQLGTNYALVASRAAFAREILSR